MVGLGGLEGRVVVRRVFYEVDFGSRLGVIGGREFGFKMVIFLLIRRIG